MIQDKKIVNPQIIKAYNKLEWTNDLSTNRSNIDEQHQHLFELTNSLISHSDADVHSEILNETIYDLLQYIDYHFTDEEAMLKELNYPKLEEHKQMHRAFTRRIANFCKEVVKGNDHVTEELLSFLTSWLKAHTSGADMDYKNYL